MSKVLYSFVLEDDLFVEYHKFMNPRDSLGEYDKDIIKKLLSYHVYPFLFNKKQLERTNIEIPNNLKMQLNHAPNKNHDLTKLKDGTVFKCILSTSKDEYPYININSDKIKTTITGTFFSTENRNKAISHITQLCNNAKSITLYDKYLSKNEANELCALLPKRNDLLIRIHDKDIHERAAKTYCFSDVETVIRGNCGDWIIEPSNLLVNSHHDRYLIIDDKLAIILTSGFSNLFNDLKEITYIVTPVTKNPLLRT